MQVCQTIRSDREVEKHYYTAGDLVEITLDGDVVGVGRINSITETSFGDLTARDSLYGGFGGRLTELKAAARRAGYRFRPFESYRGNVVKFDWLPESKGEVLRV
jgi:hypothetical protein